MDRRGLSKALFATAVGVVATRTATAQTGCVLPPAYDARCYGVVGDGSVNDGPALQAWLNAIPEDGEGFLPAAPTFYKSTDSLTRLQRVTIRGEGLKSRIHYTGSGTALTLENGRFSKLDNFYISGTNQANGGLHIKNGMECVLLTQVFVDSFTRANAYALALSNSWDVTILGGAFRQSSFGISCDTDGSSGVVNVLNVFGADCSETIVGIGYQSGFLANIVGCDFSNSGATTPSVAIEIGANVAGSTFCGVVNVTGNWFEGPGAGVWVGRNNLSSIIPSNVEIRGNYFGNSGNPVRLFRANRCRIGENHWGPGAVVIDPGVTGTTVEARGVTITDNATAGQTGYYQQDQAVINEVFARNSLRVGSSATMTRMLSATSAIDFGTLSPGAQASASMTVSGVQLGDVVMGVSSSVAVPGGAQLSADVTGSNTVTVKLLNQTGGTLALGTGTVRAVVSSFL